MKQFRRDGKSGSNQESGCNASLITVVNGPFRLILENPSSPIISGEAVLVCVRAACANVGNSRLRATETNRLDSQKRPCA